MMLRLLSALLVIFTITYSSNAQCPPGEAEVYIEVLTDDYGYEVYWELLPFGNACGDGTIFSGGNVAVGCGGAGGQQQIPGGYGNNLSIMEGPFCLNEMAQYDIFWADDWGDAGLTFNVHVDGSVVAQFVGTGSGNVFTFTTAGLIAYDMLVTEFRLPWFTYPGRPITITGDLLSQGAETITSFDLNYSVDGGAPYVMPVSGVNISSWEYYEFFHELPWTPAEPGNYEVSVWASNINGEADLVPGNDILSATAKVLEPTPVIIDDYLFGTPEVEVIAGEGQDLLVPRDLAFHPDPDRDELWVINKDVANTGGSTVRFFSAGETSMDWLWQRDPNAWHFMNLPTAIAFGDNNNFATAPGIFDANQNGDTPFTGPSLWDSNPEVYAQELFGPLGSHLDMLHVNPESQGIAHDHWNRYWVVDGYNGDITMNDFRKDHEPGNSWHGDAIIRRYAEFTILKDPNDHIVSHNVLDKNTGWLYVVDHGGQRVVRMDINTGTISGPGNFGPWETYVEYSMVTGYDWEVIITEGLVQPAGIEVIGERLLVSDHATGEIIIFDLSVPLIPEIGRIATGSPGIMGITIDHDGFIWYVNATLHQLGRVSPDVTVGVSENVIHSTFEVHPVPANASIVLPVTSGIAPEQRIELLDVSGRSINMMRASDLMRGYDVSGLANGSYTLRTLENGTVRTARFIVQH